MNDHNNITCHLLWALNFHRSRCALIPFRTSGSLDDPSRQRGAELFVVTCQPQGDGTCRELLRHLVSSPLPRSSFLTTAFGNSQSSFSRVVQGSWKKNVIAVVPSEVIEFRGSAKLTARHSSQQHSTAGRTQPLGIHLQFLNFHCHHSIFGKPSPAPTELGQPALQGSCPSRRIGTPAACR